MKTLDVSVNDSLPEKRVPTSVGLAPGLNEEVEVGVVKTEDEAEKGPSVVVSDDEADIAIIMRRYTGYP